MGDFREELQAEIEKGQVTLIIGAGVSIAATGNPGVASWTGLLKRGVEECVRVAQSLPADWAQRLTAEIDSPDIEDLLSAATKVEKKLGGPKGGDFARWLQKTVGALRVQHREVPEALAALGLPLLTTNYDDLLEEVTHYPGVTWRDSAQVEYVLRGEERGIVHLHGYWRRPDTVVLGLRSYEEVLRDEHAQAMQRALRALRTPLFVGYGSGFEDPNFGALLHWSRKALQSSPYVAYRLAREADVDAFRKQHEQDDRIRIVSYGKDYSDLAPFLRSLAPRGRKAGHTVPTTLPGTPPRPRVLIAGPDFGVPAHLRKPLREAARKPGARAWFEVQRLLERDDVRAAQLAALARYDVIFDVSPWRAFERWRSLGFLDARNDKAYKAPEGVALGLAVFGDSEDAVPEEPEPWLGTLDSQWPELAKRVAVLAPQGLALAGFSEDSSREWGLRIAGLWPQAPLVVDTKLPQAPAGRKVYEAKLDAPLSEPTLADYLRLVRVKAGQVQLTGETQRRPIEDVFVDMETLRKDPVRRPGGGPRRQRESGKEAGRASAELMDGELELREEEQQWEPGGTVPASRLLEQNLPRLFLEGKAGTGKSTLLRWWACQQAKSGSVVPVWLTRLPVPEVDLADQLARLALESVELPSTGVALRQEIALAIASGKAYLFLDALDEASPQARETLASRVAALPGVRAIISSRPVQARVEGDFVPVQLLGLGARGPEKFLESYFGRVTWITRLLREMRLLTDGGLWQRTPVLLSLAAALYARDRKLPEATLDLYEKVVDTLLKRTAERWGFHGEKEIRKYVEEVRAEVQTLARSILMWTGGPVRTMIPREQFNSPHAEFLLQSGLFTSDGRWVRFTHLTLGEFLAAHTPMDLVQERERWCTQEAKEWRLLEVLPMAHALAGASALEDVLREASEADTRDHQILSLLLQTIAYGGEGVVDFCAKHAVRVAEQVVERMLQPSGRYAEEEQALLRYAERAFRVMKVRLHEKGDSVLQPVLELPGDVGTEAHLLAWAAHLKKPEIRPTRNHALSQRVGNALALLGVDPVWVMHEGRGDPSSAVQAGAVLALTRDPDARPQLRQLLDDRFYIVREAAVQALAGDAEARPQLRELLGDSDDSVRAAAVRALTGDAEAKPQLRALLSASAPWVREAAVQALAGDAEAKPQLSALLGDPDTNVREAAVQALAGDAEARPRLFELLGDPDTNVRAAAVQALAGDAEARLRLRELLGDPAPNVRAAAVQALAGDAEARLPLRELLGDSGWDVRAAAARTLAGDAEARPQLRALLGDPVSYVRVVAAQALAGDAEARPQLLKLLDAPGIDVQAAAAQALAGDVEARPQLRALLGATAWNVRAAAVRALAGDVEARPQLRALLGATAWGVRAAAVQALTGDAEARPRLRELLGDPDTSARAAAVQALAGDAEAKPRLFELLGDPDTNVRAAAVQALAGDAEARPRLRELLGDPEPWVRAAAVQALARDAKARPRLFELLGDSDTNVRAAAVQALAGDAEARPQLLKLLDAPEIDVQAAAAQALAGDVEARPQLRALLGATAWDVRAAAVRALAGDVEARPQLRALLGAPEWRVREAAMQALAGDAEARPRLFELLGAPDTYVRAAAVQALAGDAEARPHLRALLHERRPYLRALIVKTLHRHTKENENLFQTPSNGKKLPELFSSVAGAHPLAERVQAFVKAPRFLYLPKDAEFSEALLKWLCVRLLHASPGGTLAGGRLYGEFHPETPPLLEPGARVLMRVSMDSKDLPRERFFYPRHNLMEAWRVARHLRADNPPSFFLACADVPFADLEAILPQLKPGELVWGPTIFGFRIPQGQPVPAEDSPLLLAASKQALPLWQSFSEQERARCVEMLASLVESPQLEIWALLPLLSQIGEHLPPGLRGALGTRLPASDGEAASLLRKAAQALGVPLPAEAPPQSNPRE